MVVVMLAVMGLAGVMLVVVLALVMARLMVVHGAGLVMLLRDRRFRLRGGIGDLLHIVPAMIAALYGRLCHCRRRECSEEK